MRKAFIYILVFYYCVHFIIPGIYFLFSGNFNTYTTTEDNEGILKGFLLNTVTIWGAILSIYFIPYKHKLIKPKFYNLTPLLYISIFISVVYYFLRGGFEGRLSNNMAGSILSYIVLFLNPFMILLAILFYQRKPFNLIVLFLVYLIYTTLTGSRSGVISLFTILLMYPVFSNYSSYKRSIKKVLVALLIISPVLFLIATIFVRNAGVDISSNTILRLIMGRLSFLETSMLPIHYKDMGDPLSIFYDKYGLLNQIKLIIDSLFPGNLFTPDVMPNQYYRAAFMGRSENFVVNVYTSINMTFPIYLYMYFNAFFSCIIGIGLLVLYYRICLKFRNNFFILIPLLASLYGLLIYFDWTMFFLQVFAYTLTAVTVYGFSILRNAITESIKDGANNLKEA